MAIGLVVMLLGVLLVATTYYWGFTYGSLLAPRGIRGDYMGGALAALGGGLALVFLLVPPHAASGFSAEATQAELLRNIERLHHRVRMTRINLSVGVVLTVLGLLWMVYWVYVGYRDDALRNSVLAGTSIPTHLLGGALVAVGLVLFLPAWGRLPAARAARNQAVLALVKAAIPGLPEAPSGGFPPGVGAQELRNLVKRLDSLMSMLPDSAVTEFSKTPEADTYLKLLGE